jgi:hypothetical protein
MNSLRFTSVRQSTALAYDKCNKPSLLHLSSALAGFSSKFCKQQINCLVYKTLLLEFTSVNYYGFIQNSKPESWLCQLERLEF